MLFLVIMSFVIIVMWGVVSLSYGKMGVETEEYLIGIHMPASLRGELEVKSIMKRYYKLKQIVCLLALVLGMLTLLLCSFVSVFLIVMMLWFFAFLFFIDVRLRRFARELVDLKKEKGWQMQIEDDEQWLKDGTSKSKGKMHVKRIGLGAESNISRKGQYIIWGLVFLFVVGLSVFLMKFDFGLTNFYVTKNQFHFEGPAYSDEVDFSDVTEVEWLDNYPSMRKTNGYNGEKMNIGTFNVEGYGSCRVYINLQMNSAILVQTKDKTILYNSTDVNVMKKEYNQIKDKIKQDR